VITDLSFSIYVFDVFVTALHASVTYGLTVSIHQ